ncbi:hypothetical protein L1887_28120 [Cichorium endivia]|nr:hypothetical protein L1887_28120 [Cichorium endivia]
MTSHSRSDTDTVNIAISNLQLSDDLKAYKPHLQVLIHQNLNLAFPDPRSDDDKLVMVKAKPYTAKTDPVFGEIRRLPTAFLKLADSAHPAVVSHINSTSGVDAYPSQSLKQCEAPKKLKKKVSDSSPSKQLPKKKPRKIKTMSEPSSKDSESEHLDERPNSPGSEDTQDDPFLEENQNQPPPSPPKKNSPIPPNPRVDFFPTSSQPPSDASEFDKWKFRQAVKERNDLVERLKQQFEYKHQELQTLLNYGAPSDNDSAHIKSERARINTLIHQVDSFLHSSLEKLIDSSLYLFDTNETDWSRIASAIVPLTWDKFCAQENQRKRLRQQTLEQPTKSDSRVLISETRSVPIGTSLFGADQEVDKPSSSQMHLIDLSDTNSSSDKAAKATQPQSVNSLLKDDSLHQKVDALSTLLTDLKSSQTQEPLIKEIAALNERIAALEKKDTEILLTCDTNAERIINDGLAKIDAQRETDAANMMKTAQKMLADVEKCQLLVPELLDNVELKLKEATDHMAKFMNGVLAENYSVRRTNTILLQMVTQTLQNITVTMSGPIEQIKMCTKLNMEVMDALQTMYDTPLPDCIKKEVTIAHAKLDNILARLPVTPSDSTGVPGGGKANDQPTAMIIDSAAAGPSGTKDQEIIQQKEIVEAATDSETNIDNNQNKESATVISPTPESPTPKSPSQKSPPKKSSPPISPPPINPPPISPPPINPPPISPPPINPPPISPPPINPPPISSPLINPSPIPSPKKPLHQQSLNSEDEIFIYSPIKDSDPPEIKEIKSKFFDDQANKHAKDFSTKSEPDQHQNDPTGPSKSIYSNNIYRLMTDSDYQPFKSYNPPASKDHNWDLPLAPNGDKYPYTLNLTAAPGPYKDQAAYERNRQFFKKWTKPQDETWSTEVVTAVRSIKRKQFQKAEYFEYELVRNDDYKNSTRITEADFRCMNPADVFSITMKLSHKEGQVAREAYVAARRFLYRLVEEFCNNDAEMYKILKEHPEPQIIPKPDLCMQDNRTNWKKGATFDPELGLVYKNGRDFMFLRADQLKRVANTMLKEYIKAVEKSKPSEPEAKKELLIRMNWLLEVRKFWGYAAKQGILDHRD